MSQLSTLVYIRTLNIPDDLLELIQTKVNLMNWEYWARTRIERIGGLFKNFTSGNELYGIKGHKSSSMIEPFISEDHCPFEYIEDPYDDDDNTMVVFWTPLIPSMGQPSLCTDEYPLMVKFLKYAMECGLDENSIVNDYGLWRGEQDD